MQTYTNFFIDCVKLIGYLASALNVVSCNPYVGPSGIILDKDKDIFIFNINMHISAPKVMTFFPGFHM